MSNLVVFCSDHVGLKTLEFLIQSGEQVDLVVVTRETTEIAATASSHNIKCLKLHEDEGVLDQVASGRFRWLLNLWGTAILPQSVLDIAEQRLNIHPGIVPQTRGSDCATWVIRYGLPAGVSLLEMADGVDTGGVYATRRVDVEFPISGGELAALLKQTCIDVFKEEWPSIRDGKTKPVPQEGTARAYRRADTIKDRMRNLDSDGSTNEVVRWLLAHGFSPHSRPQICLDGKTYEIDFSLKPVE